MPSAKIGDINLFFSDSGKGRPVIFVHGIPTDYRIWDRVVSGFQDIRAITYSRRCAAPNQNSVSPAESTVEVNSSDLLNLIHELNVEDPILIGHSYGGFVSLYTVWKNPGLIKTLILVEPAVPSILVRNEDSPLQVLGFLLRNPGAALSARKFQNGKLRAALKAYESGNYDAAARNFYDGIRENAGAFDQASPELRKLMLDNGRTVGELESVFPVFAKSDAASIRANTLLLKGEKSPKWLRAIVDDLGRSLPRATVVEISSSGHLPHVDNPADFLNTIRAFIGKSQA
jgi:pimeloyl-ACP methyl ester carboxylesterase